MKHDWTIQEMGLLSAVSQHDEWGVASRAAPGSMPLLIELNTLREEASCLRKRFACTWNAWNHQKEKSATLEEENKRLKAGKKSSDDEIERLKNENKGLQDKIASLTQTKDTYRGMIFKSAIHSSRLKSANPRGAQAGHKGRSRKNPLSVDSEKDVHLTHCPHCDNPVVQTHTSYERIVTDIPVPKAVVTKYVIQRQWCHHCKKEVSGTPEGTISGVRFGITFLSWPLIQKYRIRTPLAKIKELSFTLYHIPISEGGIQKILGVLKRKSGPHYQEILKEIPRKSNCPTRF